MVELFNIIFRPGEFIGYGSQYDNKVYPIPSESGPEYYTINPIDGVKDWEHYAREHYSEDVPRRADMNVSSFRNFVFEMDGLPLEDQRKILESSGIPWAGLVFSGGKSIHAILAVESDLGFEAHAREGLFEYKLAWKRICAYLNFHAKSIGYSIEERQSFIDKSCQNPSRYTRFPNSIRPDKGVLQEVLYLGTRMPNKEFEAFLSQCPEVLGGVQKLKSDKPEKVIETEDEFFQVCDPGLRTDIQYVFWGNDSGMYPQVYRICKWAIDSANPSYELMEKLVDKYIIPKLLYKYRYHDKTCRHIYLAIEHAFTDARLKNGQR